MPGLIVPRSSPPPKTRFLCHCHTLHFGHVDSLLFDSLWPQSFLLLLVLSPNALGLSPPPTLSAPHPLQHEFSNLSYFPHPNSCNNLPQPVISPMFSSIAHTLSLACTFTRSGQQGCLESLCVPTVNSYYCSRRILSLDVFPFRTGLNVRGLGKVALMRVGKGYSHQNSTASLRNLRVFVLI